MAEDRSLQLVNLSTAEIIAPLDDALVKQLKTYLEQESRSDTSFYIRPETIDYLHTRGADELADLLATALGNTQGVFVGYAPVCNTGSSTRTYARFGKQPTHNRLQGRSLR
jgi:hypothetical protein